MKRGHAGERSLSAAVDQQAAPAGRLLPDLPAGSGVAVHEVAVVGDHHDGAGELVERRLEPLARVDVEITVEAVPYEFQRGGNRMLRLLRGAASDSA